MRPSITPCGGRGYSTPSPGGDSDAKKEAANVTTMLGRTPRKWKMNPATKMAKSSQRVSYPNVVEFLDLVA